LSFMLLLVCVGLAMWVIYRTDFFDEADIKKKKKVRG
jgi:hypothetical protein